ncbi:MAG: methyltransferase domain-containing protein [Deltaproteobacteria bacterium]|nr:methyltransferase domain-containing protein [Deltaproteobacteria bacterium]
MDSSKVKERFDRIAWIYDFMESPMEMLSVSKWRKELLSTVRGKVLEVGIGTGKNLIYYPEGTMLTGIDISPRMLERAKRKSASLEITAELLLMDVEQMTFPDRSFDYVVSTFVFCSVPDPIKGLKEVKRVMKNDGNALFLEHVRSENHLLGKIMDVLNPAVRSLIGPNINRRTVDNIRMAGLEIISTENMGGSKIMKRVIAGRPRA